jgi:hypothetical protein
MASRPRGAESELLLLLLKNETRLTTTMHASRTSKPLWNPSAAQLG